MGHTINYATLTGAAKREQALTDIRNWSSCVNWDNVFRDISAMPPTKESAKAIHWQFAMFVGIQGYPIVAMLGHCWNLSDDEVVEMLKREPREDYEI